MANTQRLFGDSARVFRVNANVTCGERPLHVPFWALTSEELMSVTTGILSSSALAYFLEEVTKMKRSSQPGGTATSLSGDDVTADTPLPFCIQRLWYEMHCLHYATYNVGPNANQSAASRAFEVDATSTQPCRGNVLKVQRPRFRAITNTEVDGVRIYKSAAGDQPRGHVDTLEAKLRDPRLNFLFEPGPWGVSEDGKTDKDLDSLRARMGRPRTSPSRCWIYPVFHRALWTISSGAVLRILYDSHVLGASGSSRLCSHTTIINRP